MAGERNEEEEELISKGLYRIVSDVIGPEVVVKLRRERWKVRDLISSNNPGERKVMSGSMAEGFEMKTSDYDMMIWNPDIAVVESYSQVIDNHQFYKTVLLINCEYTSPGFALVNCIILDASERSVAASCVEKCDESWVSSKLFMEYHLNIYPFTSGHGPCQSGNIFDLEFDIATCLKCAFWPQQAASAISRMRICGWPAEDVVKEIVNDGCLLVPVASKRPMFEGASDLEWRISFSLAEKRLIYSMNHCQFLCYGLWKLFLSEVIKKLDGMDDLLCSYFLKTVVFWEISRDTTSWTTSNFLSKFMRTLRMLSFFVSIGNCPNFFLTENNMFYGKVCGEKQKTLLSYLRQFHNEGCLCLLRCPSLHNKFLPIIQNPFLVNYIAINEADYISQYALRTNCLFRIWECTMFPVGDINESLHELFRMQRINLSSDFMSTVLAIRTRYLMQNIAERTLHGICLMHTNRIRNRYIKFASNVLQDNTTFLGFSELIITKTSYISGDYGRAIHTANILKSKLQNQNTVYMWTITEDRCNMLPNDDITLQQFIELYVSTFLIFQEDTSLNEVYPEIIACNETSAIPVLFIPPLVLANFLLILCHYKTNNTIQMYDVLRELHALVHHDDNFHIHNRCKAISWEILGICQQLCEEYPAAYNSYINALMERYNDFKSATIARLNSLPFQ